MKKWYSDGKLFSTSTYEKCKVFDDKNWDCTTEVKSDYDNSTLFTYYARMNDGIYHAYRDGPAITNRELKFIHCAK